MSWETRRFMRLIVMFDLPMVTREEKRDYARFRSFLKRDGYYLLQFSVYVRLLAGFDACDKHYARLKANLPPRGSVRSLVVTEKQFVNMRILVGSESYQEQTVTAEQLLLF